MSEDKTTTAEPPAPAEVVADAPPSTDAPSPSRFGSRLLDHARKAKEQAHASATGIANKAGEVRDQVAAKAVDLKDASFAKLSETIDDFNASLPILKEAGYTLASVDIGIGIPPKIVASFWAAHDVSIEKVEQLLKEHAERKLTALLMKALFQAWKLQTKIKIAGLKPMGLSVEIGLVPNVTVKFA